MKLCTELEMENIQLEEDALVLVNAIKNEEDCWAWYDNLVEDAKQLLKSHAQ